MPYHLRRHPRARRVTLRVERDGALVVTAPKSVGRGEIDGFVQSRRAWIEGVRERLARERNQRDPATRGLRPSRIELPAIGESWTVDYRARAAGHRTDSTTRTVHLPARDDDAVIAGRLQRWLKQHARRSLTPWIEQLAVSHGFRYRRLAFRNQKSRWGSCSSRGNLSLNARLLLCSPEACRYVLIHELVHLEHPNHSPRFWQRVGELCPGYRQPMRELRTVWQRLPDWVTATGIET